MRNYNKKQKNIKQITGCNANLCVCDLTITQF